MTLTDNLKTWKNMDIPLIEDAYNKVSELVNLEQCDIKTMNKIKVMMEKYLPMYEIKCDNENNSPDILDSGHIRVKVIMYTFPRESYHWVDVIF